MFSRSVFSVVHPFVFNLLFAVFSLFTVGGLNAQTIPSENIIPGKTTETITNAKPGITELRPGNGARVILKPKENKPLE